MKPSQHIKPISYLKANAAELIRQVNENGETYIITQNGEAKVVVQDIKEYESLQDSIALLKILAISSKEMREGRHQPADKAFKDLRKRFDRMKKKWDSK